MKKILLAVAILCSFGTAALLQADKCCSKKEMCYEKKACCKMNNKKSCCDKKEMGEIKAKKVKKAKTKPKVKTMSDVMAEEQSAAMMNDQVESE